MGENGAKASLMLSAKISDKKAESYDDLMKSFRSHFGEATIKTEKSKKTLKDDFTDMSLKSLGDRLSKTEDKK